MAEAPGLLLYLSGPVEPDLVARLGGAGGVRVERRCADVAELLGAARGGLGTIAVLALGRGVDRPLLSELARLGVATIVVAAPEDLHRAGALGAVRVVPDGVGAAAAIEAAVLDVAAPRPPATTAGTAGTGRPGGGAAPAGEPSAPRSPRAALAAPSVPSVPPAGAAPPSSSPPPPQAPRAAAAPLRARQSTSQVIAVWSAAGSTGRSTLAAALAAETAAGGLSTILVDADTVAPGLVQLTGVLEEGAALSALCRAAAAGTLDPATLARRLVRLAPGLELVSGLTRGDRWREVDAESLAVVLEALRGRARVVVVDLSGGLEPPPPRGADRQAAARVALAEADDVVVAVPPDPVGVRRAVAALGPDGPGAGARRHVALVQTRPGAQVGDAADALARFAGVSVAAQIPHADAVGAAVLAGRLLPAHAPRSPAVAAIRDLAQTLVPGLAAPPSRVRRRGRARRVLTDWLRAPLRPSHGG